MSLCTLLYIFALEIYTIPEIIRIIFLCLLDASSDSIYIHSWVKITPFKNKKKPFKLNERMLSILFSLYLLGSDIDNT